VYNDYGGSSSDSGEVTWASIGDSMAQFASMAVDGGFEVNQSGGDALLDAIRRMRDWTDGQELRLWRLAQPMPLGTSHAAQVMKPYMQQVATDEQGFLSRLREFRESLDNAERGIQTAMANYLATEETNRASLRKTEPE
jgi:hypothetical protein